MPNDTVWSIYLLRDPGDPAVAYVGQTRRSVAARVRRHEWDAHRHPHRAVCAWVADVLARGGRLAVEVLATCGSADEANDAERAHVARIRAESRLRLVNSTDGGQSLYGPDFGQRIREAVNNPVTRERKRIANTLAAPATWADPEIAERRREGVRRDWQRPERQQQARDAWADPARKAARGAAISAAHQRPEVQAKQRAASKAKANRPEQKAVVSATLKAQWADPEKRAARGAAISAALKAKYASDPAYAAQVAERMRGRAKAAAEARWGKRE